MRPVGALHDIDLAAVWSPEFVLCEDADAGGSAASLIAQSLSPGEVMELCVDLAYRLGAVAARTRRDVTVDRLVLDPRQADGEQESLRALARRYGIGALPTTVAHGDLRPDCVRLAADGAVGLVGARLVDRVPAGYDLLTLLTQATHLMRPTPATDRLYGVAPILRPAVTVFLEGSGVERAELRPAIPLFFAAGRLRSLARTDRLREEAAAV
jgi:hypothetical protein